MDYGDFVGLVGAPFIVGIVEICKKFIPDDRFYPVIALLLGVIWNLGIAVSRQGDILLAVLVGVATGLAAGGLYSGQKTIRS